MDQPIPLRRQAPSDLDGATDEDGQVRELVVTVKQLLKVASDIRTRVHGLEHKSAKRGQALATPPAEPANGVSQPLVDLALALIAQHRTQPLFDAPALFENRNWVLILELFIAGIRGASVSVKEASLALGGPGSTALRRLLTLERIGVITSREDPDDGRRRLVVLSDRATRIVSDYLQTCSQNGPNVARLRLRLRTEQSSDAGAAIMAADAAQQPPISAALGCNHF